MSEPTKIPTWATETSLLQDPGIAKQATGWAGEIPPVQYFNWWMNLVGQWIFYFKNQLNNLSNQSLNYDAVIGTGGTYASINEAMLAVAPGAKLLVKDSLVLTETQVISVDDVQLEFKPGVSITTIDGLSLGIQVTASRVKLIGGRFRNFNVLPTNKALQITAAAKNVLINNTYFFNNSVDLDDSGINTTVGIIVNEVA